MALATDRKLVRDFDERTMKQAENLTPGDLVFHGGYVCLVVSVRPNTHNVTVMMLRENFLVMRCERLDELFLVLCECCNV
jgi:hypothetical protein